MKTKYEKQIDALRKKMSKLVDLYVEEKVQKEVFEKKHMDLQNEIDLIQSKVGQLSNYELDSTQIDLSIDKIKYEIQARETSSEVKLFDEELFKSLSVEFNIEFFWNEKGNSILDEISPFGGYMNILSLLSLSFDTFFSFLLLLFALLLPLFILL